MKQRKIKGMILSVFLLMVLFGSMVNVTFADGDIPTLVNQWFSKKTEIAKTTLDQAIQSELETQKIRLREEMDKQMKESGENLDAFTEEQKKEYIQAIQDHADQLIKNMNFSNEQDKTQIQSKLDKILSSAKSAMNNLSDSYTPPTPTYTLPVKEKTPTEVSAEEEKEDTEISKSEEKDAQGEELETSQATKPKEQETDGKEASTTSEQEGQDVEASKDEVERKTIKE